MVYGVNLDATVVVAKQGVTLGVRQKIGFDVPLQTESVKRRIITSERYQVHLKNFQKYTHV